MRIVLHKWWERYSTLGMEDSNTDEEKGKIRLMNQAYLFCGSGFFISFLMRLSFGMNPYSLITPLFTSIIFFLLPLCSFFIKPRVGWGIGSCIALIALTISSLIKPACFANYTLFGTIVFLIIYLFNESKKVQSFFLSFTFLNLLIFTYFSHQEPELNGGFPYGISLVIVFLSMAANYLIIMTSLRNRIQRETELAYAISLKNAALNANIDATIIINVENEITGYNQKYLEMWGLTGEELESSNGMNMLTNGILLVENKEEILKAINKIQKDPSLETVDVIYLKNGKILESYTQPQILKNKVVGRVYNYRDITQKHKAAKQLAESESRFRSFFEHSPLGIIIQETSTNPLRNMNKQFSEMLGYSIQELDNMAITDITAPEFKEAHVKYQKDLESGVIDNFNIQKKYLKKSGETFWGNLNLSVNRDEKGKICSQIVMIEDIDEQKKQEKRIEKLIIELKLLNEELEQKIKNRTIDLRDSNDELMRSNQDLEQFAYIASHDLQEPLRMIGNFVQLLERQYKDQVDAEGREYINFIVDGVNRMSKLIQNLLKYSRVGRKETTLRKIDIGKIVEAKLFGLTKKIEETGADIQIQNMPPKIYCEPDQIGMVFFNLITNALKFNNKTPKITINCAEKEEVLLFSVEDNGIGIEQKYETKVFEIFKRLHRREDYEGTGIGLALCKKIIARHGGEVWFESNSNQGTTFHFTVSKKLHHEKHVPVDSNLVG